MKKMIMLACVLFIIAGVLLSYSRFNFLPQVVSTNINPRQTENFPTIPIDTLSGTQQKIIAILQTEFKEQANGTKYSEGVIEPWCADFVSWVYNQASVPLTNPRSGSWRIPGTFTLREYYESTNRFQSADSDYTPKLGDSMIYDNPSTFGQHVNLVLSVNDDKITSIGGNEVNKIRIITHQAHKESGFIGYGVL